MPEMFEHGFIVRAMAVGIIVGVTLAVLSVIVVLKKLSFIGVGVSHSAFGGVAIGALLGIDLTLSALVFSLMVGLLIGWLSRKDRLHEDVTVGIIFAFSMSIGVICLGMKEGGGVDLFSYLFGSILAVSTGDLYVALTACAVVILTIALLFKEFFAYCFDEEWARVSGVNVDRLQDLLMATIAITVVVSIKLMGIVLVSALLVIPGAVALVAVDDYYKQFVVSVVTAFVSVVCGLTLSYYFDFASGASIVLCATTLFFFAVIFKRGSRT